MKYNKFVIFYTANYCQKIKSFFDVDNLISEGIEVEFWNLSEITAHEKLSPVFSQGLIEVKICTYDELKDNIKRVNSPKCLFMSFINFASYSQKVYKILSSYDADILYATSGVLPVEPTSNIRKLSIFKRYNIKSILKTIALRLYLRTCFFKPAKYVLISCNFARCDYKVSGRTEYISCNSGDYNRFMHEGNDKECNQIVFIDQYTPFHNDYTLRGIKHVTADKYYGSLNCFFTNIEKTYDCKVVVCAHPSALKYQERDYFSGRKVYYNDTSRQVRRSIGVIAQFSTAVSFPIMDNKPIILITTDEMDTNDPHSSSFERYLSKLLNVPMINIDHTKECHFSPIDKEAYNKYLYGYLTTPKSRSLFNSDILLNIANNNYKHLII